MDSFYKNSEELKDLNAKKEEEKDNIIKEVCEYEVLYLFNEICKYEIRDSLSPNHNGNTFENFIINNILINKNKELLDFEKSLIDKYLFIKDANKIEDVFYFIENGKKIRREEDEIQSYLEPLKLEVGNYKPSALLFTHVKEHDERLTLPEWMEIARDKLEERGLMKTDKIINYIILEN